MTDRPKTTHVLKSLPQYFERMKTGKRTYDLRNNDRFFQIGDKIEYEEYRPGQGAFTGRTFDAEIVDIDGGKAMEEFGLTPGFVVLGLKVL